MLPSRIELLSEALQTPAMTTSAKAAKLFGVPYGERSHTTTFTESGANLYTKDTIELAGDTGFEPVNDGFKDHCLRPDLANPQQIWW